MPTTRLLTLDFSGLTAFVRNDQTISNSTEVQVLMPSAHLGGDGLCRHDPILAFRFKDFVADVGNPTPPEHLSFVSPNDENVAIWPLHGRDLTLRGVRPAGAASDLTLEASFSDLLSFDDLTPGLATVDPKFADRTALPAGISCRFHLTTGKLTTRTITPRLWDLGPVGGPTRRVQFAQVVRWEVEGDATLDSWFIDATHAGGTETIQLAAGAEITLSHLCPFNQNDGSRTLEKDVLAFYSLSTLNVAANQRSVLHTVPAVTPGQGIPVRPKEDSCPPATAFFGN